MQKVEERSTVGVMQEERRSLLFPGAACEDPEGIDIGYSCLHPASCIASGGLET